MEYVRCDVGEGPRFAFADPLREGDSEDGGARLCREGSRRLAGAASTQGLGDGVGEVRELVLFAFPERGVLVDHGLPRAGVRAPLVGEQRCGRAQRGGDDFNRGGVGRCGVHPVDERLEKLLLPVEQHLALVAEVPEEGAFGQPDGLRDLRGGHLLEPAGGE